MSSDPNSKRTSRRGAPQDFWTRLKSMDFINRGMLFAAVLLLCFVPFFIILNALAGRSAVSRVVEHFGLNREAADAVRQVMTSPSATSNAISGLSYVLFVLGGIAAATALQGLYEAAFGLDTRGMEDTPRRIVWLGCLIAAIAASGTAGPWLRARVGPVVLGLIALLGLTAFWWFTMWFLLAGRRSWRALFPSGLATAVCWLGMLLVFRLTMSGTITTDYRKYGSIGVVFAIMSFLVAVGVVIIIGAIAGLIWSERHPG